MTLISEERSRLVQTAVDAMKTRGRIVIVGASLAGLRGAEALRKADFTGPLTIIGDEPDEPYDRPPLSKQVLKGWVPADHTKLPRLRAVDADWRLGVAATRLDRANRVVHLANGEEDSIRSAADRNRSPLAAVAESGGGCARGRLHAPHEQ